MAMRLIHLFQMAVLTLTAMIISPTEVKGVSPLC